MGAAKKEDKETPLDWPLVVARVDARIDFILQTTQAETWTGYLTGKGNFREEVATILPYKGPRRTKPRPFWYQGIYNYLRDDRNAVVVDGMEADDAVAIDHMKNYNSLHPITEGIVYNSIVCSRDKDLKQLPGWNYTWPSWKQEEQKPHWISELDANRFLYSQLITGDAADNILGLYNVGPKSAAVRRIQEAEDELSMFKVVKDEYQKRFGSYWKQFLEENGSLLWLLRSTEDSWKERMDGMVQHTIQQQEDS
jgi:hypothetical protein